MARQPNCIHLSISKEAAENNGITEWHCDEFDWTEPTFRPSTITGHQERNTELFEQCRGCPRKNDVLAIPVMLILQAISSITGSKTITESQKEETA